MACLSIYKACTEYTLWAFCVAVRSAHSASSSLSDQEARFFTYGPFKYTFQTTILDTSIATLFVWRNSWRDRLRHKIGVFTSLQHFLKTGEQFQESQQTEKSTMKTFQVFQHVDERWTNITYPLERARAMHKPKAAKVYIFFHYEFCGYKIRFNTLDDGKYPSDGSLVRNANSRWGAPSSFLLDGNRIDALGIGVITGATWAQLDYRLI
ncbi:hypothetical protein Tco_0770982 [Tanacetum coccineum]|uniref:Uncharacterized protein n=1 Tax=Tanacetum coccineum TaxID=301880 RepID=A0ABQ4ZFN2_9ASTR